MMSVMSQLSMLQRSFKVFSVILLLCLRLSSIPLLILNLFKSSYWVISFVFRVCHNGSKVIKCITSNKVYGDFNKLDIPKYMGI